MILRRPVVQRSDALSSREFAALKKALLSSPLVGSTTLNGPFDASRGFAVTFKEPGVAQLVERFPALGPHLRRVLGRPGARALTPFFSRVQRIPNAWYLNVLLVTRGGAVARHVDATLRAPSGEAEAIPELVSVLYLSVPKGSGGELALWHHGEVITEIAPKENLVVHFRGDLAHQVQPFDGPEGTVRASLVLEQYHFSQAALDRLPVLQLDSKAGFHAYLRAHAQWKPGEFDLEDPGERP